MPFSFTAAPTAEASTQKEHDMLTDEQLIEDFELDELGEQGTTRSPSAVTLGYN